jgi:hypothetical protein
VEKSLSVVTMYMDGGYRLANYHRFKKHMENSGVELYTVEVSDSLFIVTQFTNPRHLQLFTATPEIWHKERAINLGIEKLIPKSVDYIAWLDADITFCNPHWVSMTVDLLKTYKVVQVFSHTLDLDNSSKPLGKPLEGFMYNSLHNDKPIKKGCEIAGLGWAMRRDVFEKIKLLDWMISSGADTAMALAFFGDERRYSKHTSAFQNKLKDWIGDTSRMIAGNVNYVPGLLLHSWHGPRDNRGYDRVNRIMIDDKFDPDVDITLSDNGLYRFTGKNPKLEQHMSEWRKAF